jgi:hypothetical protein
MFTSSELNWFVLWGWIVQVLPVAAGFCLLFSQILHLLIAVQAFDLSAVHDSNLAS